jgi:hypothetical protein
MEDRVMTFRRSVKWHVITVKGTPEQVFPLLCPVREYDWIEPWRCEMIHSASGVVELDCVFRTDFPDDGPTDTWVVSRYEPPRLLEFVRVNPLRTIRYSIRLEESGPGISRWRWEQVLTGLTPEGNALIDKQTDRQYAAEKDVLAKLLDHYLATGTRMKFTPPGA